MSPVSDYYIVLNVYSIWGFIFHAKAQHFICAFTADVQNPQHTLGSGPITILCIIDLFMILYRFKFSDRSAKILKTHMTMLKSKARVNYLLNDLSFKESF